MSFHNYSASGYLVLYTHCKQDDDMNNTTFQTSTIQILAQSQL